ncbi:MAG TPA: polyribonucleotide nucleotidyltransferase, partial [Candidatus Saccharimonadales bacterium]|nr:polyribonucleotide nucleotidyltransferase [Candidatus Saccharimonadales bacterium]
DEKYKETFQALIHEQAAKEGGTSTTRDDLINKIFEDESAANPESPIDKKTIGKAVEYVFFQTIRSNVLDKDMRADGRALDELRPLTAEVGILPRTHGSAVFQRGQTQVLTVVTLGSSRMEQLIESAEGEEKKRYIHHYSFPPYSVGEAGRIGFLSRREIGHGALAERALMAVIPSADVFPYTMRLVSETLSSNGSTSMASTCGSTLALMDAGVPITKPVAGISIGKMSYVDENGKVTKYKLLTDILGMEDFSGDMDFKVAGTTDGITAIQLDVKDAGLTVDQIEEVFARARESRLKILDVMLAALAQPRQNVSTYAPKVAVVKIPVEKIGEVIGPGGRVIKNIIATTGADVEVQDDGTVSISGAAEDQVQAAVSWIQGLTREVQVGEVFEDAEVKRILPFGAFVEFLPGKEGMVHVSKMADHFVQNPSEVVNIGDKVKVWVQEIDDQGRTNLSMIDPSQIQPRQPREDRGPREHRDFHPVNEQGADKPKHPLAMQFEREKRQQKGGYNRGPKRDYNR